MWLPYWGLSRDPFLEGESTYVALPGHEQAIARLVHLGENGQRLGFLIGSSGIGKTRVLRRTFSQLRDPSRRIAVITSPPDGLTLDLDLSRQLGSPVPAAADRSVARRSLEQAVRRCAVQKQHVILAIDGADPLASGPDRADLLRLGRLGEICGGRVTVLCSQADHDETVSEAGLGWAVTVRLGPLLLSEAARYVEEKLAAAGCPEMLFSPRALGRLHLLAGGVPAGLDRLASQCLRVAASRKLEATSSELVDALGEDMTPSLTPSLDWRGVAS